MPVCAADYPLDESDERIQAALEYLKNPDSDETLWNGGEKTCYAIVAIAACGDDPYDYVTADGESLVDIIENSADAYLKPKTSASLAHEFYLLAIVAAGGNPWDFAGINVAGQLLDMFDGSQIGQEDIINDDFWAIISLVGAGVNPENEIIQVDKDFIISCQNDDGSWGCNVDGGGMSSSGDPCDTANAIMALMAAGEDPDSEAIQDGFDYIRSQQNADGGFPYYDETGASDVATDGRVMAAICAAGGDPTSDNWAIDGNSPFSQALSLQQDDGGFSWMEGDSSDGWMTAYVLPALVGKYWPPDIIEDDEAPAINSVAPKDESSTSAKKPGISANYSDAATGINSSTVSLILDGEDITASATITDTKITYSPSSNLDTGSHTVQCEISDWASNSITYEWSFTIKSSSSGGGGGGGGDSSSSDSQAPVISSYTPFKDTTLSILNPEISLIYSDNSSGIKTSSIILIVDGIDVTSAATITSTQTSYTPTSDMASGLHTVSFTISDKSGNSLNQNWDFTIETQVIATEIPLPNDPSLETVAATPEAVVSPAPEPTTTSSAFAANLDNAGKTITVFIASSEDKMLKLDFLPGTLALDTQNHPLADISITEVINSGLPETGWLRLGKVYEIGPDGASFDQSVQIVFSYQEISSEESLRWDTNGDGNVDLLDKKAATLPEDFHIASWNSTESKWELLESTVDLTEKTVTAEINHFSQYALLGPSALPLEVIAIATSPQIATLGEIISITVTVSNPGSGQGTYIVPLKIDSYFEDSQKVTLAPGEHLLTFLQDEPYVGNHAIDILGATSQFTVQPVAATTSTGKWWESVDVIYWAYIGGALLCVVVIIIVIVAAKARSKHH